ncbi:hypothetical protein [Campylobacter sp. RM16190]|uniref:hypothetical protein n=1 Tax=Campylobacter sp. RM16190 TaxID=1705727 RepID=UPI0014747F29|nr:hypothetical protein [Campylobacter sp. RM16190]
MRELVFEITFKSAVILQASSNTQGKVDTLDFIPGSNFLGMVASKYCEFSKPFDIFHSGKVRFGDAYPVIDGKEFFKIPLSYFHEKLDSSKIYNHHLLTDDDFKVFAQLKQMRSGYMSLDSQRLNLSYEYSQKSGYDKENRRSKESAMYGYEALKAGSVWRFKVKLEDSISKDDENLIKDTLVKSKRLGKSKSSEYGVVSIKFISNSAQEMSKFEPKDDYSYIYAKSRLALVDNDGNPTYDLQYICDGLSDKNIDYSKTQIRTSNFTPFNTARGTKDYERLCINKGSVIVLKNLMKEQKESIKNGVGAYLSEGFGEVLINPKFLDCGTTSLAITLKDEILQNNPQKNIDTKSNLAKFLKQKEDKRREMLDVAAEVAKFVSSNEGRKLSSVPNSQWGAIRAICKTSCEENIYQNIKNFISEGVAKEKWTDQKDAILLNSIQKSSKKLEFTKLLSMRIPRVKG